MSVQMNPLSALLILTILLGAYVIPIDGGACACMCTSGSSYTGTIACSTCTSSWCQTYLSCSSATATCSGSVNLQASTSILVMATASVLTLFFIVWMSETVRTCDSFFSNVSYFEPPRVESHILELCMFIFPFVACVQPNDSFFHSYLLNIRWV